jgi:hypothetical protein
MGKKSSGKTYTSKGERNSVASSTLNSIRAGVDGGIKMMNKQKAWVKGSNPWVTIANPNKEEKNKKMIRVRYNDLQHGSYRDLEKKAYVMK